VPGFLSCQRWIGAENAKHSVATYDLDTLAVLKSPPYLAIGGENLSPWSKRVTARCQRLLRFEGEQILAGRQDRAGERRRVLLVGMTPAPDAETEFNAGTTPSTSPPRPCAGGPQRTPFPRCK